MVFSAAAVVVAGCPNDGDSLDILAECIEVDVGDPGVLRARGGGARWSLKHHIVEGGEGEGVWWGHPFAFGCWYLS